MTTDNLLKEVYFLVREGFAFKDVIEMPMAWRYKFIELAKERHTEEEKAWKKINQSKKH